MYFNFLNNITYTFGKAGKEVSYTMKDMFSRPVIETTGSDKARIDNSESPDQSAHTLYGDPSLFYINLLLNNILNKNDWPINELNFTEKLNNTYRGYAFHVLEKPSENLKRGDIIILNGDLNLCGDDGDLDCFPTYGLIEKWDPILRKIWVREYKIGTVGASTSEKLFTEDNRFKIFHRNEDQTINLEGVQIDNESAFVSDPNYTFEAGVFTMKRIRNYEDSLNKFNFNAGIFKGFANSFMKNYTSSDNSFNEFVTTYSSGNTNGTCSLLDAYILSANGQTGSDGITFAVNNRFTVKPELIDLIQENENKRYIHMARSGIVGNVVDTISRKYGNGSG